MLVELIYSIMKAGLWLTWPEVNWGPPPLDIFKLGLADIALQKLTWRHITPTLFFSLSCLYFTRRCLREGCIKWGKIGRRPPDFVWLFLGILRIMTDPLLTSTKNNKKYKDIIGCTLSWVQCFLAHSNWPVTLNQLKVSESSDVMCCQCVWLEVMKWYRLLLSQLRPSPIHFAVFLRMCTSQPLCLCRIVGSSQTPGCFTPGGGQSHNRHAEAFSQRTAEGWDRVAWLHLNVCKTKS